MKKFLFITLLMAISSITTNANAESEAAAYDRSLSKYEGEPTSQDPNALNSSIQQSVDVAEETVVFPTVNQEANYDDMEALDARINTGAPQDWSQPEY